MKPPWCSHPHPAPSCGLLSLHSPFQPLQPAVLSLRTPRPGLRTRGALKMLRVDPMLTFEGSSPDQRDMEPPPLFLAPSSSWGWSWRLAPSEG